jgi:hypothetical protein
MQILYRLHIKSFYKKVWVNYIFDIKSPLNTQSFGYFQRLLIPSHWRVEGNSWNFRAGYTS